MAFTYSPKIVTDGLVFAVDAANTKSYPGSGTTWKDLSGNGNDGTLTNGPTFDSGNGGSIVFDGGNDFVDTSFNATSYFPLTICTWINIDDTSGVQIITDQSTGASGLGFRTNSSRIDAFWYASGNTNLSAIIPSYTPGEWTYMCVVFDTNSSKGYLNGSLKNSNTLTLTSVTATNDTTNNMDIGKSNDGNTNYIGAKIAQVKIYNKALIASEILQNYNALKGRFGL